MSFIHPSAQFLTQSSICSYSSTLASQNISQNSNRSITHQPLGHSVIHISAITLGIQVPKQLQTVMLSTTVILCRFNNPSRCYVMYSFQSILLLINPLNIFPIVLWSNKMVSSRCETGLCVIFFSSRSSFCYCLIMNTDLNGGTVQVEWILAFVLKIHLLNTAWRISNSSMLSQLLKVIFSVVCCLVCWNP